ncbi:unnamed protein product, partial [Durusdinium trenchii]
EREDLEEDLKAMSVKKVHVRVILQQHAKLKEDERRQEEAGEHEAGSFPCMADVVKFQLLGV